MMNKKPNLGDKIYWRWINDPNRTWSLDTVIAYPADGLVKLAAPRFSATFSVVSINEIEWKLAYEAV
jgi:hypothetical protein